MSAVIRAEIARYRGSTCVSMEDQPEGAGPQVWDAGAFVALDAAGQIAECDGAVPGNITAIYGLVYTDASGTQGTNTRIEPLSGDGEILMTVYNVTNPLAPPSIAQTFVGERYAIRIITISGTRYWVIDSSNAIDQIVQIQKLAPGQSATETNFKVYAKVLKSFVQYQP